MKNYFDTNMAAVLGVVIGALAHFGAIIREGGLPTWREVIGFTMQLGVIIVCTLVVIDALGVTSVPKATLTGSSMALGAREVLAFLKKRSTRVLREIGDGQ